MEKNLDIIPFESVGQIKFGTDRKTVENLFEDIPKEMKTWTGKLRLTWDNLAVVFNKEGLVQEVCFVPDGKYNVFLNGQNVLSDDILIENLKQKEIPTEVTGCLVFFQSGISVTGFEGCKETVRAVTVFSPELIDSWKSMSEENKEYKEYKLK